MKKIILWSSVSIVIVGLAVWGFIWWRRPQVIKLDDGTKLTLLGVDYGKHHKYPVVKVPGARRNGPQSYDTPEDALVVWVLQEHKPQQWPNFNTLIYDRAETACVGTWTRNSEQVKPGMDIAALQLDAFPRRDGKFIMRFMQWGNRGQHVSKEQFVISNPARGSFSKWTPTPLPITQSDGDLDVTLTQFKIGVPGFGNGGSAKDPANLGVMTAFTTMQNGVTATNWQPVEIKTSDATGNHVQNWSTRTEDDGEAKMSYQWGLWPNESAWKLNVEMSRKSGFTSDELWTITELPVRPGSQQDLWGYNNRGKTNIPFAETTLNGVNLKIFSALQFNDQNYGNGQKRGGFRITADSDPTTNGFRMTALVTDETGRKLQSWNGGSGGGNFAFQIPDIRNAKSLNITIALHKSRFVDFIVKPTK